MRFSALLVGAVALAGLTTAMSFGRSVASFGSVGCQQSLTPMNPGIGSNTSDMRLVLGRVWLPISLGTTWRPDPARLAKVQDPAVKHGMVVTAGSAVVVEVPSALRSLLALNYGKGGPRVADGQVLDRFTPCPKAEGVVTVWAGFYRVKGPLCARLTVHAGGRVATVSFPLGRRC
jgi:hypothetical protein